MSYRLGGTPVTAPSCIHYIDQSVAVEWVTPGVRFLLPHLYLAWQLSLRLSTPLSVCVITKLTTFFFTPKKQESVLSFLCFSLHLFPLHLACPLFFLYLSVRRSLPPSAFTWADRSPRRRASRELRNWMSCSLKPAQRLATMSNR